MDEHLVVGLALVANELAGRGRGLAEGTRDHIREPDGRGDRDRYATLGTGEGSEPEPGRPLGRSQLDLRGAQLVIALRIGSRRWIEEQPHKLIMARRRANQAAQVTVGVSSIA